jgi:hypothetical protein
MILEDVRSAEVNVSIKNDKVLLNGEQALIQIQDQKIRIDSQDLIHTVIITSAQFFVLLMTENITTLNEDNMGLWAALAFQQRQDEKLLFADLASCQYPMHLSQKDACAWPRDGGGICGRETHFALTADDPRHSQMEIFVPICLEHDTAFRKKYAPKQATEPEINHPVYSNYRRQEG